MKKYIKAILLGGVLAMSAAVFSASADTIKIGFNVPLTGFAAADGQSALHGAELAVSQVNGSGGVNGSMLELVVYDDQASPKESGPLAVKMITKDNVVASISGSYSGATRAAATIFAESKFHIYLPMPFILILLGQVIMSSEHPLWVKYRAVQAQN